MFFVLLHGGFVESDAEFLGTEVLLTFLESG